jgi:FG-GAP repeat
LAASLPPIKADPLQATASSHVGPTTADFNGDGYSDLATGVPGEAVGSVIAAGAVSVLYGGPGGVQADAPNDQLWTQDTVGIRDKAEEQDKFGGVLASGDFNGDGYSDLAVGSPRENVGTLEDAGAVSVLYGSAAGLQADSPDDDYWNQNSPGIRDNAEVVDLFGWALATGDFDSDGFVDLAIGIQEETVGSIDYAGAVAVLYGSASGLQADAPDDDYWNQNSPGVRDSAEANDGLGSSLATGDFDGNGYDDLAIGVTGETVGSWSSAGAAAVLYGSAGGLQADSPDDDYWNQNSTGVQEQAENADFLGDAIAAGDFDADGYDDLAMGAPGELLDTGEPDQGVVNVLYGSSGGLQAASPDDQLWQQGSPVADLPEQGDTFGGYLSAGDVNGDGFADLVIGASGEDLSILFFAGAFHVLFGSGSGLQATSPDDQFWTQDSAEVQDSAELRDFFGAHLAVHDFNGDGYGDVAVGISTEDVGSLEDAGGTAVLYGSAAGLQAVSPDDQFWTQDSPGVEEMAELDDGFGADVA